MHASQVWETFETQSLDSEALAEWMERNGPRLRDHLDLQGGVRLRSTGLRSADDFSAVLERLHIHPQSYEAGTTPRSRLSEGVYTSTQFPRGFKIHLHSELSYRRRSPRYLAFLCLIPPKRGGQTILGETAEILRRLPPTTKAEFLMRGVSYRRTLITEPRGVFGKLSRRFLPMISWQEVFGSTDREEVEKKCRDLDLTFAWKKNGDLELVETLPPVRESRAGRRNQFWFSSVHLFQMNRWVLGRILYYALLIASFLTRRPRTQCTFGDGTPIADREIKAVFEAHRQAEFAFDWERGDLLIVDNYILAHGRNPYRGDRKVVVSMFEGLGTLERPAAPL